MKMGKSKCNMAEVMTLVCPCIITRSMFSDLHGLLNYTVNKCKQRNTVQVSAYNYDTDSIYFMAFDS